MKNIIIRVLSIVLCLAIICALVGCGGKSTGGSEKVEKVSFPLKEPVNFTFMVQGTESSTFKSDLKNNSLWKELEKKTNVHIDFQFLGDNGTEKLSLLVNSGEYGDVLWGGPILNTIEASKYMAAGVLKDLTNYITEEIMPELSADIAENPSIKNMITASDGKIYTLPKITGLEGSYLESPIWINKAWLDKLGLAVPKTLNEFTNCLRAFSTKDPNGNGLPDEIPYIASTSSDSMHLEALMGMWGIATKDGSNDAYVQIRDGKVTFVPTLDEYKEAINYLSTLYKEKLLWNECFTSNSSTLNAKLTSETCVVGCFTSTAPAETDYASDYICIAPPKVDGYDTCWYYHPAISGSKNQFYVTDKCQNTSVLMAWVDQFYDLSVAIGYEYGSVGDGRVEISDNGKYTFLELDDKTTAKIDREHPTLRGLMGNGIRSITSSDFADKINLSDSYKNLQNNYSIYKDVINKNLWPRPYYSAEDSYDADTYATDINYQVSKFRASWITGKTDINKEWDSFKSNIKSIGLDEYIAILQRAYDSYNSLAK